MDALFELNEPGDESSVRVGDATDILHSLVGREGRVMSSEGV